MGAHLPCVGALGWGAQCGIWSPCSSGGTSEAVISLLPVGCGSQPDHVSAPPIHLNVAFTLYLFIYLFFDHVACGILVPLLGMEPVPPPVEAWSLNHWTAREVPTLYL